MVQRGIRIDVGRQRAFESQHAQESMTIAAVTGCVDSRRQPSWLSLPSITSKKKMTVFSTPPPSSSSSMAHSSPSPPAAEPLYSTASPHAEAISVPEKRTRKFFVSLTILIACHEEEAE